MLNSTFQERKGVLVSTLSEIRPLNVIHVVSSLKVGGMEQVVLSLAEDQRGRGHAVHIVAFHGGPLEDAVKEKELTAVVIDNGGKISRICSALSYFRRAKPHIIHAHNPTSLHYAVMGKLFGNAKVIMTDHAQTRGIVRTPGPLEHRLTDIVVAVSQDTAERAVARGWKEPVKVIHNGVSLVPSSRDRFAVRRELGLGNEPVGIMVAGFDKVKGHGVLLEALASLPESQPLTALLVGGGQERAALEELAKRLNLLENRVRFLGIRSDVADLLVAADFFVLPSFMEGLPLAILEAMTAGLPVVATPVGGVAELVEDGASGFLVPVNDPRALASAMIDLLSSPELIARFGDYGKRRVENEFSFKHMTNKYEDIYQNLAGPDY